MDWGLQSIERTVEQYGGNMKITIEKGTFSLRILLYVDVSVKDPVDG